MTAALGWNIAGARHEPPRLDRFRRGDFGEVLAIGILQQLEGYAVPVVNRPGNVAGSVP